MNIHFTYNGDLANLIVSVTHPDDLSEVVNTLKFLEKLLCRKLSYSVDYDYNEVHLTVDDYYEFITFRKKILDHCFIA